MKPLDTLSLSFVEYQLPPAEQSGVYLLILDGVVIYVGASRNVPVRLAGHFDRKKFDRAIWKPLPWRTALAVEGALARMFLPAQVSKTAAYLGRDNEILASLGLPVHDEETDGLKAWKQTRVPMQARRARWRKSALAAAAMHKRQHAKKRSAL